VAGGAVGEEDYSHSNHTAKVTPRETHIQKEIGYLDRKEKVLALGMRLGGSGGSVTPEISRVRSQLEKGHT